MSGWRVVLFGIVRSPLHSHWVLRKCKISPES